MTADPETSVRTDPVDAEPDELSTQPAPVRSWHGGPLALARNSWRRLTSMRTALVLLFLLALASVPGSLLPQRPLNPAKVDQYIAAHPGWSRSSTRPGSSTCSRRPGSPRSTCCCSSR